MAKSGQHIFICPKCDTEGAIGEPCPEETCRKKDYRFVPKEWVESSRRWAEKKHKPFDPLIGRKIGRYLVAGKIGEAGWAQFTLPFRSPC